MIDRILTAGEKREAALRSANVPARGLSRIQAAAYIGVSPVLFDEMVEDGRMPKPKKINARVVWDRLRLDEAWESLPDDDRNPWDDD